METETKRYWNDVGWMFTWNGSLRDIYVHDTRLSDWEVMIDFLNLNYDLKFGPDEDHQIDKDYVLRYLQDETAAMESRALKINLDGIYVHCYFFQPFQIELDITPKEINALDDFERVEQFMGAISKILHKEITLTEDNSPELPYFTIDFYAGVNKVHSRK